MNYLIGCPSGKHMNDGRCSCPERVEPLPDHSGSVEWRAVVYWPGDRVWSTPTRSTGDGARAVAEHHLKAGRRAVVQRREVGPWIALDEETP